MFATPWRDALSGAGARRGRRACASPMPLVIAAAAVRCSTPRTATAPAAGYVVWLHAPPDALARRVGAPPTRARCSRATPRRRILERLAGGARPRVRGCRRPRRWPPPAAPSTRWPTLCSRSSLPLALMRARGGRVVDPPYDVVVGAGVLARSADSASVVAAVAVARSRRSPAVRAASTRGARRGPRAEVFLIADGEEAKSSPPSSAVPVGRAGGPAARRRRRGVGGGVVGDTAGFAAACTTAAWPSCSARPPCSPGRRRDRGQDRGQPAGGQEPRRCVPPTGRGARRHRHAGHPPEREYRAGLGEVAKYALMGGPGDRRVAAIDGHPADASSARDPPCSPTSSAAAPRSRPGRRGRSRERTGLRATLNYGHTLAHALDTAGGHDLLHGEAVAVAVFAGALAEALDAWARDVDRHRVLRRVLGLPNRGPDGSTADAARPDAPRQEGPPGADLRARRTRRARDGRRPAAAALGAACRPSAVALTETDRGG